MLLATKASEVSREMVSSVYQDFRDRAKSKSSRKEFIDRYGRSFARQYLSDLILDWFICLGKYL